MPKSLKELAKEYGFNLGQLKKQLQTMGVISQSNELLGRYKSSPYFQIKVKAFVNPQTGRNQTVREIMVTDEGVKQLSALWQKPH